jgi:hypothetical protein
VKRFIISILAFFALFGRAQDLELPVAVHPGILRWGNDVRGRNHMVMGMSYTLENTEREAFSGTVTLIPETSGNVPAVVSQFEFNIGPEAVLQDTGYRPAIRTESISVRLADSSGNLLSKTDIPTPFEASYYRRFAFLINDDFDLSGVTDLSKSEGLLDRMIFTRVKAFNMPCRWTGYSPASLIVFHKPDLNEASASQLQAVRDFVSSGGTLLVTCPQGVRTLAESPLSDMLPVDVLGARPVASIPALVEWAMAYRDTERKSAPVASRWQEGTELVELAPRKGAFVPVSQVDLPLVCWRRQGAGWVGVTAFDLWDAQILDSGLTVPVWNHILSWSGDHPYTTGMIFSDKLNSAVQRLSGFNAADATTIHRILLINALVVVLVLAAGVLTRRQPVAWLVLVLYGIVVSGVIFTAAKKRANRQSPRSLVAFDFVAEDEHSGARAVHLSFFSHAGDSLTVSGATHNVCFYPPTPPLTRGVLPMLQQGGRDTESIQLVEAVDGVQRCENFRVRALRNRTLGVFVPVKPNPSESSATARLRFTQGWPELITDIETATGEHWYLALGNGVVPCRAVEGETTTLKAEFGSQNTLKLDPVLHELEKFLNQASLPRNTLVGVRRLKDIDAAQLPLSTSTPFELIQYEFRLIPVDLTPATGEIRVDPSQISISPASRSTQSVMALQNEMIQLRNSTAQYLFAAAAPPHLSGLAPGTVEIELSIINPGSTLEATPELCIAPVLSQSANPSETDTNFLSPNEVDGSRFTFRIPSGMRIVDPVTGRFFIRVNVTRKAPASVETAMEFSATGDAWQFQKLNASMTFSP